MLAAFQPERRQSESEKPFYLRKRALGVVWELEILATGRSATFLIFARALLELLIGCLTAARGVSLKVPAHLSDCSIQTLESSQNFDVSSAL
jgi:hypothetical protein